MEFIEKIKSVLTEPSRFFSQIGKEKGIGPAFVYLLVLTIISSILAYIVMIFTGNLSAKIMYTMMGAGELAAMADPTLIYGSGMLFFLFIIGIIAALVGSFVVAAILHVWILIFGGKNTYVETYKLYVYKSTPSLLLGWIPLLNMLTWIWGLVLLIIGTMKVHNISKKRAILMYVIPLIVLLAFFILGMVMFGMLMARTTTFGY
ncbi:YIP1 family protein [Candidatus Woesearchaeota archaeon]|nr:YIP1 family protein [Candidatus Woesearchaeota archaeon]MBW3013701.1 YIP1 family protein [Candidatus Woesearchaeota archaeon]